MLYYFELLGTAVFAITGVLSAERKQLDYVGVIFIAFVVGNGGGTIRDILLNVTPFWMTDPNYVFAAVIPAIIFLIIGRYIRLPQRMLLVADALGLALFTIVGTSKSLTFGMTPPIAVILGVITAVGGGVIRDLVCDDIPLILRGEIYVTASLSGALVYVFLLSAVPLWVSFCACMLIVFTIRMIAIFWHIKAPFYRARR